MKNNNQEIWASGEMDNGKRRLLTITEVCSILNVGRNTAYKLIKEKDFPVIRIRKLIRVPEAELTAWISRSVGSRF